MKYLDLDGLKYYSQTLDNKLKNKFISASDKGKANGVASLDETGNIPLSQLGNVEEILINAAIYVQGSITIAAGSLNGYDVLESPDSIIFDTITGTFYAYDRNNDRFYTSWSANLQNNIYPPEKYGAVINNTVYPLPKQMYRFEGNNNIYICSYPSRIARMTILKIE